MAIRKRATHKCIDLKISSVEYKEFCSSIQGTGSEINQVALQTMTRRYRTFTKLETEKYINIGGVRTYADAVLTGRQGRYDVHVENNDNSHLGMYYNHHTKTCESAAGCNRRIRNYFLKMEYSFKVEGRSTLGIYEAPFITTEIKEPWKTKALERMKSVDKTPYIKKAILYAAKNRGMYAIIFLPVEFKKSGISFDDIVKVPGQAERNMVINDLKTAKIIWI